MTTGPSTQSLDTGLDWQVIHDPTEFPGPYNCLVKVTFLSKFIPFPIENTVIVLNVVDEICLFA